MFLLGYVALLLGMAQAPRLPAWLTTVVVAGNALRAVGCLELPLDPGLRPNALGIGHVLLQALAVLVFAVLEWTGLRASMPAGVARSSAA